MQLVRIPPLKRTTLRQAPCAPCVQNAFGNICALWGTNSEDLACCFLCLDWPGGRVLWPLSCFHSYLAMSALIQGFPARLSIWLPTVVHLVFSRWDIRRLGADSERLRCWYCWRLRLK
jgi:hypothetical protein